MYEKRIAIYARAMSNEVSLDTQINQCKVWARKRGYLIDEQSIYQDKEIAPSAHPCEREQFSHLLEAARQNKYDFVLVACLDHFFGDDVTGARMDDILKQFGVEVIEVELPGEVSVENAAANSQPLHQLPEMDRSCEAVVYLRQNVKHKMAPEQRKAECNGYDGRSLPPGLVLERIAPKTTREPVVYEPWQKIMFWIFDRGEELGYDADAIMDEIAQMPYLFPEIPEEDQARYEFKTTLMHCPNGGYKPKNAGTIRSWWGNILLVGGWPSRGESSNDVFVLMGHHPAVVDIPRFKRFLEKK